MTFTPLSANADSPLSAGGADLRGWEIRTMADGEKVGEIHDLLLDEGGVVRYLDVDLQAHRKHILVPTVSARIDQVEEVVWVPGMRSKDLERVPAYQHDPDYVTPDYERRVAQSFSSTWPAEAAMHRPGGQQPYHAGIEPVTAPPTEWRPTRTKPLVSLAEVGGYEVAPGSDDPRGWQLVLGDGRRVGTVHDLLIDTDDMRVGYLDCELTTPGSGGRHILVPVGYTRLERSEWTVYLDDITTPAITALPSFPGLPLAPEDERRIHEIFTRASKPASG